MLSACSGPCLRSGGGSAGHDSAARGSDDMAVRSTVSSAQGGGAEPGLGRTEAAVTTLTRGARQRWCGDEGGRRRGRSYRRRPTGEEGVGGGSRLQRRRHQEGARVRARRCDFTGGGAERGRAARRRGARTRVVGRCSDSEATCGFGQQRQRGQLQTGAVRAAFKARARDTVVARRRVARRVAPGGDDILTSGPGTERKKPTVGSRVTENSQIKNTP
jgi:hypothetical protein